VSLPTDCPLDPGEYFVAWGYGDRWTGYRHGDPAAGAYRFEHCCDCDRCLDALAELDPGAAERVRRRGVEAEADGVRRELAASSKRVDVGPVREHLRQLLASGRSMTSIAVEAGVDKTTLVRAMRPDVKRLHVRTAEAVLAVGA
jgi:hypothetical protein